uniref:Uncharacterized protein n=1 Tax=Chromera velia CCMP2878 TaxID=1169474 RepID=A0A0G4FNC2_9ALVE|eukprot:Cvel_17938.t1-p1 / transcript=Cvel_17938.t1 / gene=Cvel_17938 / organism=Chromera_velia_CCMP2878 / gene_product=hypothetical protein / transcript_product=hypothetical protein / location=Cvel_scaffold1458:11948-19685(+) / protein_length=1476 / sequence_SO=supercontig / SO=protein_coding / is_pseudo=false
MKPRLCWLVLSFLHLLFFLGEGVQKRRSHSKVNRRKHKRKQPTEEPNETEHTSHLQAVWAGGETNHQSGSSPLFSDRALTPSQFDTATSTAETGEGSTLASGESGSSEAAETVDGEEEEDDNPSAARIVDPKDAIEECLERSEQERLKGEGIPPMGGGYTGAKLPVYARSPIWKKEHSYDLRTRFDCAKDTMEAYETRKCREYWRVYDAFWKAKFEAKVLHTSVSFEPHELGHFLQNVTHPHGHGVFGRNGPEAIGKMITSGVDKVRTNFMEAISGMNNPTVFEKSLTARLARQIVKRFIRGLCRARVRESGVDEFEKPLTDDIIRDWAGVTDGSLNLCDTVSPHEHVNALINRLTQAEEKPLVLGIPARVAKKLALRMFADKKASMAESDLSALENYYDKWKASDTGSSSSGEGGTVQLEKTDESVAVTPAAATAAGGAENKARGGEGVGKGGRNDTDIHNLSANGTSDVSSPTAFLQLVPASFDIFLADKRKRELARHKSRSRGSPSNLHREARGIRHSDRGLSPSPSPLLSPSHPAVLLQRQQGETEAPKSEDAGGADEEGGEVETKRVTKPKTLEERIDRVEELVASLTGESPTPDGGTPAAASADTSSPEAIEALEKELIELAEPEIQALAFRQFRAKYNREPSEAEADDKYLQTLAEWGRLEGAYKPTDIDKRRELHSLLLLFDHDKRKLVASMLRDRTHEEYFRRKAFWRYCELVGALNEIPGSQITSTIIRPIVECEAGGGNKRCEPIPASRMNMKRVIDAVDREPEKVEKLQHAVRMANLRPLAAALLDRAAALDRDRPEMEKVLEETKQWLETQKSEADAMVDNVSPIPLELVAPVAGDPCRGEIVCRTLTAVSDCTREILHHPEVTPEELGQCHVAAAANALAYALRFLPQEILYADAAGCQAVGKYIIAVAADYFADAMRTRRTTLEAAQRLLGREVFEQYEVAYSKEPTSPLREALDADNKLLSKTDLAFIDPEAADTEEGEEGDSGGFMQLLQRQSQRIEMTQKKKAVEGFVEESPLEPPDQVDLDSPFNADEEDFITYEEDVEGVKRKGAPYSGNILTVNLYFGAPPDGYANAEPKPNEQLSFLDELQFLSPAKALGRLPHPPGCSYDKMLEIIRDCRSNFAVIPASDSLFKVGQWRKCVFDSRECFTQEEYWDLRYRRPELWKAYRKVDEGIEEAMGITRSDSRSWFFGKKKATAPKESKWQALHRPMVRQSRDAEEWDKARKKSKDPVKDALPNDQDLLVMNDENEAVAAEMAHHIEAYLRGLMAAAPHVPRVKIHPKGSYVVGGREKGHPDEVPDDKEKKHADKKSDVGSSGTTPAAPTDAAANAHKELTASSGAFSETISLEGDGPGVMSPNEFDALLGNAGVPDPEKKSTGVPLNRKLTKEDVDKVFGSLVTGIKTMTWSRPRSFTKFWQTGQVELTVQGAAVTYSKNINNCKVHFSVSHPHSPDVGPLTAFFLRL